MKSKRFVCIFVRELKYKRPAQDIKHCIKIMATIAKTQTRDATEDEVLEKAFNFFTNYLRWEDGNIDITENAGLN